MVFMIEKAIISTFASQYADAQILSDAIIVAPVGELPIPGGT